LSLLQKDYIYFKFLGKGLDLDCVCIKKSRFSSSFVLKWIDLVQVYVKRARFCSGLLQKG
jgi:hypothetical protein